MPLKVDEFHVEAVLLKSLEKIRIGHDSRGSGAGWFLDKVVIRDPQDDSKAYEFACNRFVQFVLCKDNCFQQFLKYVSKFPNKIF